MVWSLISGRTDAQTLIPARATADIAVLFRLNRWQPLLMPEAV
jgi:hypothetical protein